MNKRGIALDEAVLIEDLLEKMLCYKPCKNWWFWINSVADRLDADACLEHPWLSMDKE